MWGKAVLGAPLLSEKLNPAVIAVFNQYRGRGSWGRRPYTDTLCRAKRGAAGCNLQSGWRRVRFGPSALPMALLDLRIGLVASAQALRPGPLPLVQEKTEKTTWH